MTNVNQDQKGLVQSYIEQEKTFSIDAFDLEEITKSVYSSSIEMLESSNDTTHQYNVDTSEDEYSKKTLENAIKNGYLEHWNYSCILNNLCTKGLIEKGKYFVRMSW